MTVAINFNVLSLAQLKVKAAELNAKVEGDRRLKATWVKACEAAQAALTKAGEAIDEFTGYPIAKTAQSFSDAVVEAYGIAHTRFVVPTEKGIAAVWNFATSDRAMKFYVECAISVMRFCFALYRAFLLTCQWVNAIAEERENEPETELIAFLEVKAVSVTKTAAARLERKIWELDGVYQSVLKRIMDEVRSLEARAIQKWMAMLIS